MTLSMYLTRHTIYRGCLLAGCCIWFFWLTERPSTAGDWLRVVMMIVSVSVGAHVFGICGSMLLDAVCPKLPGPAHMAVVVAMAFSGGLAALMLLG